jgi:acetolactate synthase-1/3 small subunit
MPEVIMKHTLSVLTENLPGVLTHVSALISRRGYNIETIAASSTEEADVTRISLVVEVFSQSELEQIVTQLDKLVHVIKVLDLTNKDKISREMALIKIRAQSDKRGEISNVCDIFRARIVDVHPESMVVEVTGEGAKIDAFCGLMEKYGIVEIIRTGEIFLTRYSKSALNEIADGAVD